MNLGPRKTLGVAPMSPDRFTRRAARLMVDRYGEGAGAEARRRARDLRAAGDARGAAACRAMLRAIDEALRERQANQVSGSV